MVNTFLSGHPKTIGHGKESNRVLLGFSLSATLTSYYDAKVIVPFL